MASSRVTESATNAGSLPDGYSVDELEVALALLRERARPAASAAPQTASEVVEVQFAEARRDCTWSTKRLILMLRQVNEDPPFLKPHKQKGTAWEELATTLMQTGQFNSGQGVDGTACRNKYNAISRAHRKAASSACFRSGSDEEVNEVTTLLDELVALEDQKDIEATEAQQASAADAQKKEIAGALVRQAATALGSGDEHVQPLKKLKKENIPTGNGARDAVEDALLQFLKEKKKIEKKKRKMFAVQTRKDIEMLKLMRDMRSSQNLPR